MKRVFVLCFILSGLLSIKSWGQSRAVLKGAVYDGKTQEPVAEANIVVVGTSLGDVSNFNGQFFIKGVPPGKQTVRVSLLGYKTKELVLEFQRSSVVEVRVELDEDIAVRFGEIVISANRMSTYPQIRISHDEISNTRVKDVGEFIRTIPGGSAIRKGGIALDPVLHGFRQDQLNVMVDGGMHVWGACPNRMDPPTAHIQAEDLEKVEILGGPFSVRFGPTLGGIINLVMDRSERFAKFGLNAVANAGYESNWNGRRGRLSVSSGTRLADIYISGGLKDYGSYKAGDGSTINGGFDVKDYSLKLGLNPGEDSRIQATNRASFMRDVYYPALPMDAYVDDTHMYGLDVASNLHFLTVTQVSAKIYGSFVHHIMGNQWKPTFSIQHAITDVKSNTYGARIELSSKLSSRSTVYVGMDGYENYKSGDRRRNMVSGPLAGKSFVDTVWQDAHLKDIGVFAEAHAAVSTVVTALLGVRLDAVSSSVDRPVSLFNTSFAQSLRGSELNPSGSAGFMWSLSDKCLIQAALGLGSRTADISERYINLLPVGRDNFDYLGNPSLKPEQNLQLELSTDLQSEFAEVSASAFTSIVSNYISAKLITTIKPVTPGVYGVKQFYNVSNAHIAGAGFSATFPLNRPLRVSVKGFYTYGQNMDLHEPLPEIPPLEGDVNLFYRMKDIESWIMLGSRFVAPQYRISTSFQEARTPGFAVFSIEAGKKVIRYFTLSFRVTNIFNKAYYEHLNRINKLIGSPILEPGRSVDVNVSINY